MILPKKKNDVKEKIVGDDVEIWKPVVGYEGKYEVSSHGRVASLLYRKTGKRRLIKVSYLPNRYPSVRLYKGNRTRRVRLCYLVATAFIENPHNNLEVECIDGNKSNNHVSNIRWVAGKENSKFLFEFLNSRGSKQDKSNVDNGDILFSIWDRATDAGEYKFIFDTFRKTYKDPNHPKHAKICSLVLKFLKLRHSKLNSTYNPNSLIHIHKRAKEAGEYSLGYCNFSTTYRKPRMKGHKQVLSLVLKFAV